MANSDDDDQSSNASPGDSGGDHDEGDAGDQKEDHNLKTKQSSNAKDPSRPRRKKARRACFACQRAHLTCGDERPCLRCIKRGLQDQCQDGVRKKAKYLHDAPNEALMPGAGAAFAQTQKKTSPTSDGTQQPFFADNQIFNRFHQSSQMAPPNIQTDRNLSASSFTQQSPLSANFNITSQAPVQSPSLLQDPNSITASGWGNALFDDPSLFNFDLASMNFGNHYGALEFGMLGHMATNAGETPPDATVQRGSVHQPYRVPMGSFSDSPTGQRYSYTDPLISEWQNGSSLLNQNGPNAFAIESTGAHFMSPGTNDTPENIKHDDSPSMTSNITMKPSSPDLARNFQANNQAVENHLRHSTSGSTAQLKPRTQLPNKSKRPKDPSTIYTTVTSPHPYTQGFHALFAYLQRRFATSPAKTLAIAKSLASIRPSFIATTKTLNREDLIFMEKCFQRTLWEYEGFIEGVGTPTIVARRTGEIAAVGKEFQILTGWTKNVLLGRAPNLNVNRGHTGSTPGSGSGANTGGRGTGFTTPTQRLLNELTGERRPQPVLLAELLDDDSVVQFYEDFARLAFGDSRGSVKKRCKLLKYRTKEDEVSRSLRPEGENFHDDHRPMNKRMDTATLKRQQELNREGIAGERGMRKLGSADGKVDCAYCWTVKRDVFDIPMLIVMNFLPCI